MTSHDVAPHKKTDHDYIWQIVTEFTQTQEPGSERLVVERVAEAIQRLNWPTAQLAQLKMALAQAARKAAACDCQYDSQGALVIRVLIPENDPMIRETSQAGGESTQLQAFESEDQHSTQSPSRGWGFFLIEKAVPNPDRRNIQRLIEVFLYPEGAKLDPNSHRDEWTLRFRTDGDDQRS